jgi:hypothetical protein
MLCGVPASLLVNAIVNGFPAGTVTLVSWKAIPLAVMATPPDPELGLASTEASTLGAAVTEGAGW